MTLKLKLEKFDAAFVDRVNRRYCNGCDNDLAEARRIMASRKFVTDNMNMIIDPLVEKDLTTLHNLPTS